MYDLYKELERTCERTTKELHDLNDRLEQNKSMMTPQDLDILTKISDIIKDTKSTMKKIIEIDMLENQNEVNDNGYSGSYMRQPMWDTRMGYSGNSYRGSYTMNTGNNDGYSGSRIHSRYSRDNEKSDMISRLEERLSRARNQQEADAIRATIDAVKND